MVTLLHLLSYVGSITAFLFVTLSLASGLLWIAELIEEHTRYARTIGVRAIYVIIVLHALLYVVDGLPFLHIVFSIFCHVVYLQHFSSSSWPFISLTSPVFILSCLLVVADHFLWFFHFAGVAQEAKRQRAARYRYSQQAFKPAPSFMDVAAFFAVCVWFIPLFLFLSLSANDNVIPSFDRSAPASPMGSTVDLTSLNQAPSPSRSRLVASSSLVKSVLAPIVDLLPRGRRSNSGIIAPPIARNPSPSPSHQGYAPWGSESSPNHTPPTYPNMIPTPDSPSFGATSGRLTPPPPSRPPKSRSASQLNVNEANGVSPSSPTARSRTVPPASDMGGGRNKAD